jgi:uncharacterized protein
MHNKMIHMVAFILVIVGGLNWLFIGAFDFNLVTTLLGSSAMAVKVVYILVGLAAVYEAVGHKGRCKVCNA